MDIRRIKLWESRNATVMTNDLIQVVIEDQGGTTLELSAMTSAGGAVNAHLLPHYRGRQPSVYSDENSVFWQSNPYLYQRGGSHFSFPHFGSSIGIDDYGSYTAASYWMVERYGTDAEFGGVWLLSSIRDRKKGWKAKKIDMLLPLHPVHYSAIFITNTGDENLVANAVWNNEVGPPFLEAGCVINASADSWMTVPAHMFPTVEGRLAPGAFFNDLRKAPLKGGGTADIADVPFPIGKSDFIQGRIPAKAPLGYSSIINPRMQMIYLMFFEGPAAQEELSIPMNFNSFGFDFGGRAETPWALYNGGMSQQYSMTCANGTHNLYAGLNDTQSLLEADTTFTIEPQQTRHLFYGTAFAPYENARIGGNFFSAEQQEQGIVLKRTKSTATIAADSSFHALRALSKRVLREE